MAVFGAVIGGELFPNLLGIKAAAGAFPVAALGLSVVGCLLSLVLLGLMRRSVGPQRDHKRKDAYRVK